MEDQWRRKQFIYKMAYILAQSAGFFFGGGVAPTLYDAPGVLTDYWLSKYTAITEYETITM